MQVQESLASASEVPKIVPVAAMISSLSDLDCRLVSEISTVFCGAFFPVCTLRHQVLHFWAPARFQGHFHPLRMHPPTRFTRLTVLKHFVCFLFRVCMDGGQLAVCVDWKLQAPGCR